MKDAQPRPWKREYEEPYEPELLDADGNRIVGVKLWEDDADYPGGDLNHCTRANAKFVLDAVNTFDVTEELIEAVEKLLERYGPAETWEVDDGREEWSAVENAITKARARHD